LKGTEEISVWPNEKLKGIFKKRRRRRKKEWQAYS
jgi:hypothetical protein